MSTQVHPFEPKTKLGALQSVYGYNSFARNSRLILSGLTILGMLGCLGMTLYAFMTEGPPSAETRPDDVNPMFMWFCLGGGWLLGGALLFSFLGEWLKLRHFMAALYEDGLAISDKGHIELIAWAAIQRVQSISYRRAGVRRYVLSLVDGRYIVLHQNLDNIRELGETVAQRVGVKA